MNCSDIAWKILLSNQAHAVRSGIIRENPRKLTLIQAECLLQWVIQQADLSNRLVSGTLYRYISALRHFALDDQAFAEVIDAHGLSLPHKKYREQALLLRDQFDEVQRRLNYFAEERILELAFELLSQEQSSARLIYPKNVELKLETGKRRSELETKFINLLSKQSEVSQTELVHDSKLENTLIHTPLAQKLLSCLDAWPTAAKDKLSSAQFLSWYSAQRVKLADYRQALAKFDPKISSQLLSERVLTQRAITRSIVEANLAYRLLIDPDAPGVELKPQDSILGFQEWSKILRRVLTQSSYATLRTNEFYQNVVSVSLSEKAPGETEDLAARALRAIQSRSSNQLTAYDAKFEEEYQTATALSTYSVSDLEILSDCPQRYFFRTVLKLENLDQAPEDRIPAESGTLVHESLKQFYALKIPVTRENFQTACNHLKQIALEQFEKSKERQPRAALKVLPTIDWDSSAFYLAEKEYILRGLDQALDAKVKLRGPLRRALELQLNYFSSYPIAVEAQSYANKSDPFFYLERVQVRGIVDRIDQEQNRFHVWDYKTGSVPSRADVKKNRSLQPAIYSAIVEKRFGQVARVGFIPLGGRNNELEEPTEVTDLIDQAKTQDLIHRLDQRVRQGDFSQVLETTACSYCEFSRICFRDQRLLEKKLLAQQAQAKNTTQSTQLVVKIKQEPSTEVSSSSFSLSPLQLLAADPLKSVAVRAGAGSGKTQVLVTRYLRQILIGASVKSILVITFTEKAAEELKRRIYHALERMQSSRAFLGNEISEEALKSVELARVDFSQARISTIHGFARALILRSGLERYQHTRIIAPLEREELLSEIFRSVLVNSKSDQLLKLYRHDIARQRLADLIKQAISERFHGKVKAQYQREALEQDIRLLLQELAEVNFEKLISQLKFWNEVQRRWFSDAQASLETPQQEIYAGILERTEKLEQQLTSPAELSQHRENIAELSNYLNLYRRRALKKPKNYLKILADLLEQILPEISSLEAELAFIELTEDFEKVASAVAYNYQQSKLQRGAVDFFDLLLGAEEILSNYRGGGGNQSSHAGFKYLDQIRHLMLDEFQDTDARQWQIVKHLLTDEGRTLFVVGDEKQSIYRFRGAEVNLFREAVQAVEARNGRVISLTENYRSEPQILDFVNHVFATEMADLNFEPLTAKLPSSGNSSVEVFFVSGKADSDKDAAEAQLIAREIKSREIQNGGTKNWIAPQQEIAILARTRLQLEKLALALGAAGIPYTVKNNQAFFELQEVNEVELFLKFIAARIDGKLDAISLVGLLRSSLLGYSDQQIYKLSLQHDSWEKCALSLPQIATWCQLAQIIPAIDLLESIFLSPHFGGGLQALGYAERIANVQLLIATMRELDPLLQSYEKLARWIAYERSSGGHALANDSLAKNKSVENRDRNQAPLPVVLSTIHAAKGLEFDTVILPFLSSKLRERSDAILGNLGSNEILCLPPRKNQSVVYQTLKKSEKISDHQEELRIYYVACTRAKKRLLLSVRDDVLKQLENESSKYTFGATLLSKGQLDDEESPHCFIYNQSQIPVKVLDLSTL
ncbi:UvrD-helicase domain-containing protein [bacterium]|nr:UvrD-helicase domain-containing protein [bacterium]